MYIPIPVMIVFSLAFLLIGQTMRSSRRRDPLLGDQAPAFRPAASQREQAPIMPVAMLSAASPRDVRSTVRPPTT
jgi:hypothetical protein